MYKKEDFEIDLPSLDYLQKSKLIKKIGMQCTDFSGDLTDYWTSDQADEKGGALSITAHSQVVRHNIDTPSGVRPIIRAKNLSSVVRKDVLNGHFPVLEFGDWYTAKTVQLPNPTNLKFTGRSYPIGETKMGLEVESDNKKYLFFNDKFRLVVPIEWYYDEENDLLLSVHSLFYSLKNIKLYNGNFVSFSLFNILDNQVLPLILDSENKAMTDESLDSEIQKLLGERRKLDKKINSLLSKQDRKVYLKK